jgi:hypothetical protein
MHISRPPSGRAHSPGPLLGQPRLRLDRGEAPRSRSLVEWRRRPSSAHLSCHACRSSRHKLRNPPVVRLPTTFAALPAWTPGDTPRSGYRGRAEKTGGALADFGPFFRPCRGYNHRNQHGVATTQTSSRDPGRQARGTHSTDRLHQARGSTERRLLGRCAPHSAAEPASHSRSDAIGVLGSLGVPLERQVSLKSCCAATGLSVQTSGWHMRRAIGDSPLHGRGDNERDAGSEPFRASVGSESLTDAFATSRCHLTICQQLHPGPDRGRLIRLQCGSSSERRGDDWRRRLATEPAPPRGVDDGRLPPIRWSVRGHADIVSSGLTPLRHFP